jgi:hypothetical protein
MAMCSTDDIKVHVNPECIADLEIDLIIESAEKYVLRKAKSSDTTNADLIEAVIHQSAAMTIKKARAKGELASSVETPESKISITGIIEEIKQHEEDRDYFISSYKESYSPYLYSSASYHAGFDHTRGGH